MWPVEEVTRLRVGRLILVAILVVGSSISIPQAEVMDKEQSVASIWGWAAVGGVMGLIATRYKWWLGFITLPVAVLIPAAALLAFHDPYVGPAIAHEAGSSYGLHCYCALAFVVIAHVLGLFTSLKGVHRWRAT